jgi:hypothetical protein
METYVAFVGEQAVLAFRAEDDDQAHAMIEDKEGTIRSDLKVLVGREEKPLWDGKSAIRVREATAAQHAEWEQSRNQAISDEEIDLDAGDDPDEWSVYLARIPQKNFGVWWLVRSIGSSVSMFATCRSQRKWRRTCRVVELRNQHKVLLASDVMILDSLHRRMFNNTILRHINNCQHSLEQNRA